MKRFRFLFRDRSLAYKFTLLTTIPVITVAVCIALLAGQALEQSITEATNLRVKRNTSLVALSMSNPYIIYNKAVLDTYIDSLKQETDIIYAVVVDYNDGRILSHSNHSLDGQYYKPKGSAKIQITGTGTDGIALFPGTGYEAVSPIHIAEDLFGTIRVGFTLDTVYKKIAALRAKIIGITFLAIAFSVLLSVFIARLLNKPILSLAFHAQEMAEGNFAQEITYESKDAVGRLSNAFQKMNDQLKERLHLIEANEEKYRALFEASNDAVFILDEEKIIDCNQQALTVFQCEFDDIFDKPLSIFLPDKQPDKSLSNAVFNKKIIEVINGHRHRFYCKFLRFDKTELDGEVSLSPTVVSEKKIVLAVVQDITERKTTELKILNFNQTLEKRVKERTKELKNTQDAMLNLVEDLNESKQDLEAQKVYLEQLFEASPEAIVHLDEKDQVIHINKQFSIIFGFNEAEIKGTSIKSIIIPEFKQKEAKTVNTDLVEGKSAFFETKRLRKDKSIVDVSITGMPIIIDGKRKGAYAIYRDICDRKKVEKELKEAQNIAHSANRAKGEFLANMSHEIRTPLNAISGLTYLAKQTDLTPQQHDYLLKIDSSAEGLLMIINDILDFSKIEADKLVMESVEFYLEDVLNKVADMLAINADEKELEFIFATGSKTPQELVGDPLRLGQILINLVGNAIKFTEKGEVVIKTRLVEERGKQAMLKFDVCDTGIGLSDDQQKKLFQAFSQADTSTTRKFGGTGLGLIICKRLVKMMGGEIEFESEPGKGSTFSFTALLGRHSKKRRLPLMLAEDFKNKKALVVDDSRTARHTLKRILESMKLEVTQANSGPEALKILELNAAQGISFDMVFTDFKMPLMDGLETARHIKSKQHLDKIPIMIMVTAFGKNEILKEAEQIGLDGFITKPVSPSTTLDSIMAAFGKKSGFQTESHFEPLKDKKDLSSITGARILLAEDNEINQQVAFEMLLSIGLEVIIANNGAIAMEMLQNELFDAVLMDVQMPVMDGLTAAKKIRELKSEVKNIPIIALTANAMIGDRKKSIKAGMNDHITKPLDPEELFRALVKWIKPLKRPLMAPSVSRDQTEAPVKEKRLLPKLPGIDTTSALSRVGGNQGALIRLIKKFSTRHADSIEEIDAFIKAGEIKKAARSAHTLKGVSGNIGAVKLHKAAENLELAIKKEHFTEYENLLELTRKKLKQILDSSLQLSLQSDSGNLNHNIEKSNLNTNHTMDMKKIMPVLSEIKTLLENNSFSAGKHVTDLEKLICGDEAMKELAELKKHMEGYQFKKALKAVNLLRELLKETSKGESDEHESDQ